jgi:hypothetical protein
MQYIDFFKLGWKKFKRSPNFQKKLAIKILMGIGLLFLLFYMIGLSFLAYYGVKEEYPNEDVFKKASEFLYIYFFIIIYIMMYVSFDGMNVQHYMLLPIVKKKIVNYHILRSLFHPTSIILLFLPLVYSGILLFNGYPAIPVLAWAISVISILFTFILLLFFSGKNALVSVLISLSTFFIIIKIDLLTTYLAPLGLALYKVYENPLLMLIPLLILLTSYFTLYKYIFNRFYIDGAIKAKKKEKISKSYSFAWLNNLGVTGAFLKNDLRMIWRNARPKQGLYGGLSMFVFAILIFSGFTEKMHLPYFYKIFVTIFLTGFFVVQFGSLFPAWDSGHYKLLMTQNLNYKQYIESKWWIMALSVILLTIISLPFIYFGIDVYLLILAMAIFNIGVNIPLTLFSGMYNLTPIKLNQKVKSFQSNDSFSFKLMLYGFLRIAFPIILYLLVEKYISSQYAMLTFVVLGLLGLIFRKPILNFLSRKYIARKYATIAAFSKAEAE